MFGTQYQRLDHLTSVLGTDALRAMHLSNTNAIQLHIKNSMVNSSMTNSNSRKAKAATFSKTKIISILVAWIIAVIAIALTSSFANGQAPEKTYKSKPLKKEFKMVPIVGLKDDALKSAIRTNKTARAEIKRFQNPIREYLEGSSDYGTVSAYFKPFFEQYVFAKMTDWETPNNLSQLGEMREEFFKYYLNRSVAGAERTRIINDITIPFCQEVIDDKAYHPAARLNAVVLLGMLNTREGDSRADQFPFPSAAALQVLVTVFNDPKYEPFLKVGAVAGIKRHLEVERAANGTLLNAATKASVSGQAMAILKGNADGQADWADEVSYWLKRRGVQILGLMGNPGNNGEVFEAILAKLKTRNDNEYWLRFDCLTALSKLNLKTVAGDKLKGVAFDVADFVAESLENEANHLDKEVDELLVSNVLYADTNLLRSGTVKKDNKGQGLGSGTSGLDGDGAGGGGAGGKGKKDEIPKIELPVYHLNASRRRVKTIAYMSSKVLDENGSNGLYEMTTDEEKQFIKDGAEFMKEVIANSDVGIRNLELDEEEQEKLDENPVSVTKQMSNVFREAAKNLKAKIAEKRGDEAPAEAKPDATKPADAAKPAENTTPPVGGGG